MNMIDQPITESNFLLMAMHHYDNAQCTSLSELEEDIKRFGYLKKLFSRYHAHKDLKERLILNHLIVLYNVFGLITTDFLFFKIDRQFWNILATFLVFIERMPQEIPQLGIKLTEIELDPVIIHRLRNI